MKISAVAMGYGVLPLHFSKKEKKEKKNSIISSPLSKFQLPLTKVFPDPSSKETDFFSKAQKSPYYLSEIDRLKITQMNITVQKYSKDYYGLMLLNQNHIMNRNQEKYEQALKTISTIGFEKLTSQKQLPVIEKQNPVLWSVTSEFAPVKEGGLGVVPPAIRDNAQKLGVGVMTFVPLYLNEGFATLTKNGENYKYLYKNNEMLLEKIATIKMDVYKNGNMKSIPVDFFLHTQKDEEGKEKHLVFVKADDYFDGTIYQSTVKTEEPEKFAVFSKAVYELLKIKTDGLKANKEIEIYSNDAFEKIKQPDGMILNDWQASPLAALLRYKAVLENAYGQIGDESAEKLKDMRVLTIGHNAIYQGSTQNNNNFYEKKVATQNVLNTLFDEYTYDIVSHAYSGASTIEGRKPQAKVYDNVLLMNYFDRRESYTNLLNMGIILSDYFAPVSKNYAKELVSKEHKDLSYELQWALIQKNRIGKLIGIINGNDYDKLSLKAKKEDIKKTTGVEFEVYDKSQKIDEIMKKRQKNKADLYNKFILPYTNSKKAGKESIDRVKSLTSKLEFYQGVNGTSLPVLTKEELENTPILTSGGRLVSQKGVDILCDAMVLLFENWEKDFPKKNKPIFYIVGADNENGTQRKYIEDLKNNRLTKKDNNRVLFAHGYAPMPALMAGSDFFLITSKFEPCGLVQSESLALGTPVIASYVGGIVDTVNRDNKINGILTSEDEQLSAQAFYESMKEGLKIYFDDKEKYKEMVKNSVNEDFSWIKKGKKGPVYNYLDLFGIKRENLADVN